MFVSPHYVMANYVMALQKQLLHMGCCPTEDLCHCTSISKWANQKALSPQCLSSLAGLSYTPCFRQGYRGGGCSSLALGIPIKAKAWWCWIKTNIYSYKLTNKLLREVVFKIQKFAINLESYKDPGTNFDVFKSFGSKY